VAAFGQVAAGQVVLDFGSEGPITIPSLATTTDLDPEVFVL
jgi:hypothetical protein